MKKIKEKCECCKGQGWTERSCCQNEDLVMSEMLSDSNVEADSIAFCKYCGDIFIEKSRMDAAGSREYYYKKIIPEELPSLFCSSSKCKR